MIKKNDNKPQKNIEGTVYEVLSILLFLLVCSYAGYEKDVNVFYKWLVVPLIPFLVSLFYKSGKIGDNLKKLGISIVGIFTYLDSIGINGLPAISMFVLIVLGIVNFYSSEKMWSEMVKITGGIFTGSLAQARITIKKNNKKDKK